MEWSAFWLPPCPAVVGRLGNRLTVGVASTIDWFVWVSVAISMGWLVVDVGDVVTNSSGGSV